MQERFLEGRTALVTGSVQGIGLAIGKALASAGARLAVHGLATREQADAAIRTMREAGAPDARFFDADMRKPAAINAMMDAALAWGGPDILVNNAGIQQTASLAEVTQQIWDDILAVNLSGAFHTMRRALPEMAKRGYGRVINVASVHGLVASANKAPYVSAKFGLVGLSRVAALEYAAAGSRDSGGITVNCICPGWTETATSNRRFRRERPRSAETAMPRFPVCSRRNSQAGGHRGRRRSERWHCGSPTQWHITSLAQQSRSTAAGRLSSVEL
jgi:3-hydroxybutyrate dehydrogenase